MVFYEYAITLGDEIEFFWQRNKTGAGLLFFSNRYISLAVNTYLIFWNMISKSALPKEVR